VNSFHRFDDDIEAFIERKRATISSVLFTVVANGSKTSLYLGEPIGSMTKFSERSSSQNTVQ
jgi:hypothetical protein